MYHEKVLHHVFFFESQLLPKVCTLSPPLSERFYVAGTKKRGLFWETAHVLDKIRSRQNCNEILSDKYEQLRERGAHTRTNLIRMFFFSKNPGTLCPNSNVFFSLFIEIFENLISQILNCIFFCNFVSTIDEY